jgi:kynurenine formamidase
VGKAVELGELAERTGPVGGGSFSYSRLIDLSWPVSPGIPQWPGDPAVETEVTATIERDGYYLRRFAMGEHSGTHLTAPSSFYNDGAGPEDYRPGQLVVPAVVFDVRDRCEHDPDFGLTRDDLQAWEAKHGRLPEASLALLNTGWPARWRQPAEYLGLDDQGRLHFPGFSLEAVQFLMEERSAAGLGTDTAGVEPGADETFSVSKLVLAKPRIVLENLTNLGQLPATGSLLVIGLLRLAGGSGAPASVTAFVP